MRTSRATGRGRSCASPSCARPSSSASSTSRTAILAGAFTPDRLTVLSLLASQAAISVENARLLYQERAGRTAAEETRKALEDTQVKLRRAQRIAHVGYWIRDLLANRIELSDEASRIFGLQPQELTLVLERWQERWPQLIHPEDRSRTAEAFAEALRGGPTFCVEYRVIRPSGEVRHVRSEAEITRDESGRPRRALGMMQDITERWTAEEQERAARAAAEAAKDRSAFLAEAGALLSASLDYEQTLARLGDLCVKSLADWCVIDLLEGRELHRLAGACTDPAKQPLLDMLCERHPARWDSPHASARSLRAGKPILLSEIAGDLLRSHCEDDDHFDLVQALGTRSIVVVPLLARGQTLGILSLVSGALGRYRRTDLELAQEVAHLAGMAIDNARLYREVQRADKSKSEFIAVLSHELRNPLAPIRTSLQLLRRCPPGSPVATHALEIVERQTNHLTRLVNDLLDITRISHGRIELQRTRVDLREVIRSTCNDLGSLFEGGALELRLEPMPDPVWLDADATRLVQVLGNLLQNAAKFTPAGGSVIVRVTTVNGRAELSVRDTGVGIAADLMKRMFEPFAQAAQNLARVQGGLGLGLALAKSLVELHGGSIQARSEGPGEGPSSSSACRPRGS